MAPVSLDAPAERLLAAGASRRSSAERLIATGRVVLAAFSLLAIWLDPSEPARFARTAYLLLITYLAWSAVAAAVAWLTSAPEWWLLLSHGIDVAMFSLLVFVTAGPSSPFFVFFVFALVSATLCWGARGTAATGLLLLAVYLALGAYSVLALHGEGFDLTRFITRSSYLAVVGLLLGYLGAHQGQLRTRLLRLLDQRAELSDRSSTMIAQQLEQAARLFDAGRSLFVWEEQEEPWVRWGLWEGGEPRFERASPGTFEPFVAEALASRAFSCQAPDAARPFRRLRTVEGDCRPDGVVLHPELRHRFQIRAALSVPVTGGGVRGRMFLLEPRQDEADDLVLAELFARRMSAELENLDLLRQLQGEARNEVRARLARELHDGVIQSLTAAGLRLDAAQRLLPGESPARSLIDSAAAMLGDEQEELRAFIRQSRPSAAQASPLLVPLGERLEDLERRIGDRWGLRVDIRLLGETREQRGALAHEIDRICHEALVNAARHGAATHAALEVALDQGAIRLVVADNGRGFPFRGHYPYAALVREKLGPLMLKQRVAALGGELTIDSGPQGARLEIRLPWAEGG